MSTSSDNNDLFPIRTVNRMHSSGDDTLQTNAQGRSDHCEAISFPLYMTGCCVFWTALATVLLSFLLKIPTVELRFILLLCSLIGLVLLADRMARSRIRWYAHDPRLSAEAQQRILTSWSRRFFDGIPALIHAFRTHHLKRRLRDEIEIECRDADPDEKQLLRAELKDSLRELNAKHAERFGIATVYSLSMFLMLAFFAIFSCYLLHSKPSTYDQHLSWVVSHTLVMIGALIVFALIAIGLSPCGTTSKRSWVWSDVLCFFFSFGVYEPAGQTTYADTNSWEKRRTFYFLTLSLFTSALCLQGMFFPAPVIFSQSDSPLVADVAYVDLPGDFPASLRQQLHDGRTVTELVDGLESHPGRHVADNERTNERGHHVRQGELLLRLKELERRSDDSGRVNLHYGHLYRAQAIDQRVPGNDRPLIEDHQFAISPFFAGGSNHAFAKPLFDQLDIEYRRLLADTESLDSAVVRWKERAAELFPEKSADEQKAEGEYEVLLQHLVNLLRQRIDHERRLNSDASAWIPTAFKLLFSAHGVWAFASLACGFVFSVFVPFVGALSVITILTFPVVAVVHRAVECELNGVTGNEFQNLEERIRTSPIPEERASCLFGIDSETGAPIGNLWTSFCAFCLWLVGSKGSGKTASVIMTLFRQAANWISHAPSERGSIVIADLKGGIELLWFAIRESIRTGLPIRILTTNPRDATHLGNIFQCKFFQALSVSEKVQLIAKALSLHSGFEHGRGYFSSQSKIALRRAFQKRRFGSWGDLADFLEDPTNYKGRQKLWQDSDHLKNVVRELADIPALNAKADEVSAETLDNIFSFADPCRLPGIYYLYIPAGLNDFVATPVVKTILHGMNAAATLLKNRLPVIVFIDEAQRIGAPSDLGVLLQQGRAFGFTYILANQSRVDFGEHGEGDLGEKLAAHAKIRIWLDAITVEDQREIELLSERALQSLETQTADGVTYRDVVDKKFTVDEITRISNTAGRGLIMTKEDESPFSKWGGVIREAEFPYCQTKAEYEELFAEWPDDSLLPGLFTPSNLGGGGAQVPNPPAPSPTGPTSEQAPPASPPQPTSSNANLEALMQQESAIRGSRKRSSKQGDPNA